MEKNPSRYDFPRAWGLMLRGAARISFVVAGLVLGACAESDSHTAKYSATSFYGPHYSYADYGPYGTNGGFRNPSACWRSAWQCPVGRP